MVFLVLMTAIILLGTSGFYNKGPDVSSYTRNRISDGEQILIKGTVVSGVERPNSILYILSDAYTQYGSGQKINSDDLHSIMLYTSKNDHRIKTGSSITACGKLERYEHASNPGAFDAFNYYRSKDCYFHMYSDNITVEEENGFGIVNAINAFKEKINENIISNTDETAAAVLEAVITGDRSGLTSEIRDDYSVLGLSHILAVSGLHVGLIGMMIYKLLLKLRLSVRISATGGILFIVLYTLFIGSGESTVRAAVMFIILFGSKIFLRSYDALNSLSLAGTLILIINPVSLFNAGFQMSFLAAFAASIVYPRLIDRFDLKEDTAAERLKNKLIMSVTLWSSVNLFLLPVILYHYYEFPLYSLISNIVFVPAVSILLIFGIIGSLSVFALPIFGRMLFFIPMIIIRTMSFSAELVRRLPYSTVIIGRPQLWQLILSASGLIMFLWFVKRRGKKRYLIAAVALILCVLIKVPKGFFITALDVGQGEGIVVNSNVGCFIVDGGSSSEKDIAKNCLIPYLEYNGIDTIEAVLISHMDKDHISGIEEMLEMQAEKISKIRIKKIVFPYWLKKTKEHEEMLIKAENAGVSVLYAVAGDMIEAGDMTFHIISPQKNDGLTDNEGSMVISLKYKGFKALLTGDLEGAGEEILTKKIGNYDYLKVAHHGSKNSTSDEFLDKTDPAVCIISAPEKSIYGHPHKETVERIEEHGSMWYQTGLVGAVTVTVENNEMRLSCFIKKELS